MLQFKEINPNVTDVYNDGKKAGSIVKVAGGYQYRPKGVSAKMYGKVFNTNYECRKSLKN